MSRSNIPPTNKKSVKCPDCGRWITLQGYGGHRRFYHGEYERDHIDAQRSQNETAEKVPIRNSGKYNLKKLSIRTGNLRLNPDKIGITN